MSENLGSFRIERKLLEDESSACFAVHDPRDGSDSTLQILSARRSDLASSLSTRAGKARSIHAQGWLPIRDLLEVEGRSAVQFEVLVGKCLTEVADRNWKQLCGWLADVCDALHALHGAEILHGALTARNIWVGEAGAQLVGLAPHAPAFDATGRRNELGAVASILVEALTNQPSTATSGDALDDATLVSASAQLSLRGVEVPPRLQSILDDLLTPVAGSELATAADVANALREVSEGEVFERTEAVPALPPDPVVGTTMAGYEILRVLGKGGMGVVYEALDPRLDRRLALKRVRSEALGESGKARFLTEARACSRITHPNVVTVYASGEEDGDPYMAMELLTGETLKQMRAAGDVGWEKAIEWTADVLGALALFHADNIVHRDLKLDNIMLTADGTVKLMDFGLATMDSELSLTSAGSTVGTVWYMSPEQASGHKVDPRSDLFSMGVVLYELLSGKRPFTGEHPLAVMLAIQQKDYLPISKLEVELPASIDAILRRALAKDPAERYGSAEQFRDDLLEYLAEARGEAPPRRRSWIAAVVGGFTAAFVAAIVVMQLMPSGDRNLATHHNELGVDHQAAQEWTKARVEYRESILADPSYAIPYNNLGFLALQEANYVEADSLFRMAIERDSEYGAAHFNLATSRWDQGDRSAAEASYRNAIVADPDFPGGYGNLGALLLELDRIDDAGEVLDSGLEVAPADAQLLRHRGRVDQARGDMGAAIARWAQVLQTNPDDYAVLALLAPAVEAEGDSALAIQHYAKLSESPNAAHQEMARTALERLRP